VKTVISGQFRDTGKPAPKLTQPGIGSGWFEISHIHGLTRVGVV